MLPQQIFHREAKYFKINTDLVFENGISKVFRKFAHSTYVGVVFLVAGGTRAIGQGLQLVLDTFKSTGVRLMRKLVTNERMVPTQIGPFVG